MARRSLRPHLNQIRGWVRQGRTDAWIAHQLEVTVQQIEAFKRENDLVPDGEADGAPVPGAGGGDFDDEIDLRAEDDALIAAELEAAEAARAEEEARRAEEEARRAAEAARGGRRGRGDEDDDDEDEEDDDARRSAAAAAAAGAAGARAPRASSRGPSTTARRATGCGSTPPSRTTPSTPSTGPATGPSSVTIEEDQIVIRRAGDEDDDD